MNCNYGSDPVARDETHGKVIEMRDKESRGKVLDVPTGTGISADRLIFFRKYLGFNPFIKDERAFSVGC